MMRYGLMDWYWYALLAAISFTIYSIFVRQCLKNYGDAKIFSLLAGIVVGVLLLLAALFEESYIDLSPIDVVLILVVSGLYAIEGTFLVWARQLEQVSTVEIVRQTGIIWGFAGGVLLLDESLSPLKVLGSALILVGSVVALWKEHHFVLGRGLSLVLVAAATLAFTGVINRVILEDGMSPALYGGIVFLLSAVWLYLVLPDARARMTRELKLQRANLVWVNGLLAITFFALMNAFQQGDASMVVPVFHSSLIFAVVGGILFLGERDRFWQKVIAAVVAFIGIILLRLL